MNEYNLKLDYYELLNLHKALLEAKFHTMPDNELIAGSPIIAGIHIQIRELLIKSDRGSAWKEWFLLRNRPDYRHRAILLMKNGKAWTVASTDKKREIASSYLAPFLFEETELLDVIAAADGSF